ncbi:SH3 domain-containing protein [Streptomyces bambusae]|uniref:SH3 domain-containing protein n=1 Tax=Streptomyces bambusae TaxID=1550616 RepID=A0ABS6Z928_9ACTN|nr:SH3 domain-containing protein [Streptomyces bambusae]MBW5484270.1 SH3 domain-containing protein [Streptomyces bambusae]
MITNFRSKLTKYGLVSAALVSLAVPAAVVATAGPAAAASCTSTGSKYDGRTFRMTAGVAANMRSGPSTQCAIKGWADNQNYLVYYCWEYNFDRTATWTYLYNSTDRTYGWVSDHLLPSGGANERCYV